MEELDENGDGEIDFQEFLAMMQHQAWGLGFKFDFLFFLSVVWVSIRRRVREDFWH